MIRIEKFVFNPFMENTYVLSDDTRECIIIDPGCCDDTERHALLQYIVDNDLKPVRLINTHCHVDHIPGNPFVSERFGLGLEIHRNEIPVLERAPQYGEMFGFICPVSPEPKNFLEHGDEVRFGSSMLKVLLTPGHSPGSISLYNDGMVQGKRLQQPFVIAGDVLFKGSVGRYDIPGADSTAVRTSITQQLYLLPDETMVWPGHFSYTTIGEEKRTNPFVRG